MINSIKSTNATIPIFLNRDSNISSSGCGNLKYKRASFEGISTTFTTDSALCNHEKLQSSVDNFGFMNISDDIDGIFRRVHLFAKYRGETIPSFGLATIMSIGDELKVVDSNSFTILGKRVKMNSDSSVLINFHVTPPKVVSVVDLLYGRVSPDEFKGKSVIIGSLITALNPSYRLSSGDVVTSSMINGFLIQNILSEALIVQPNYMKIINL